MNKSETIGNLAKALSNVQSSLNPAKKDSQNPYFKSSYADLNSVWDACRDLLAENKLAVSQLNQITTDGVIVETVLLHESGEWISGEMFLPLVKSDPQGVGSAITYGRRYGLAAIVGIVADDDDDANHASGKTSAPKTEAKSPNATGDKRPAVIAEIKTLAQTKNIKVSEIAYGVTKRTNYIDDLTLSEAEKALEFLKRK